MSNNPLVIIGGSFNPITNAHLFLGEVIAKEMPKAKILYIPTNIEFISSWKITEENPIFSSQNRDKILTELFNTLDFEISFKESKGELSGSTFDTIKYFKQMYDDIYFVIGSDKLTEIEFWENFEEMMNLTKIILFTRNNVHFDDIASDKVKQYKNNFLEIDTPQSFQEVSSTKVRKAYYNNNLKSIQNCVPKIIYNFLAEN